MFTLFPVALNVLNHVWKILKLSGIIKWCGKGLNKFLKSEERDTLVM